VADEAKPVALQRETGGVEPAVAHHDAVGVRLAAADPLVACTGCADQGDRHRLGVDEIGEGRLDGFRGDGLFDDLNHQGSSTFAGG